MVIKRSSSAEITRLIDALLTSGPVGREAAAARLAILGSRALERLSQSLASQHDTANILSVLDVLDRIGDPRAADMVEPLLRDSRIEVAKAAVAVVRRGLGAKDAEAAARATDRLLALGLDARVAPALRHEAIEALSDLPEEVLGPLRDALPKPGDSDHEPARQWAGRQSQAKPQLTSWVDSGPSGSADDLRQAVKSQAATAPLPVLHHAIQRLREIEGNTPEDAAAWRQIRGAIHQALADRKSRVALYDLREMLEGDPGRLTVAMIAALSAIGDSTCVEPAADAWARAADDWLKEHLRDALQAIVVRESLTRRHAALKRAGTRHPELIRLLSIPAHKPDSKPAR